MTIEVFLKRVMEIIGVDGIVCRLPYGAECTCSYDELAYQCDHRVPINQAYFFRYDKGKKKKILDIRDILKPERCCDDNRREKEIKEIKYLLNLILEKLNK